jgi:hypothetical protein
MAYAFARATHEDMAVLRAFISDDGLRDALDHAPPGIIDPRSWSYWNAMVARFPAPAMPQRRAVRTSFLFQKRTSSFSCSACNAHICA